MTLPVASTSTECCITVVASMADKSVSTEDLHMYSPPPVKPNKMSSVVANELLRLEAALNAVMAATSPTEDEIPVVRRPRSHSHHHCYHDITAVHPRRSRRSASAIVLQNSPYLSSHHLSTRDIGGPSPGPSTISSDGFSRGRINSDHLCLPVTEVELQGPLFSRDNSSKRRKKKRKKRKLSSAIVVSKVRDPGELPKRARWTIVATAGLLLFMCVLLVGITLRMAPIIDEMVRKENEQLMNSLNRAGVEPVDDNASTGVLANLTSSMITTPEGSTVEVATALPPEPLLQNQSSTAPPP